MGTIPIAIKDRLKMIDDRRSLENDRRSSATDRDRRS